MMIELKIVKTRIFEAPVVTVFVSKCGVGEGVDRGWMPLPPRPQRYCDPVTCSSSLETRPLKVRLTIDL